MGFMNLYTYEDDWFVVETKLGGDVVPADLIRGWKGMDQECTLQALADYCEGEPVSFEVKHGWCARYSADGYMDRTDWCGPYETEDEAVEECKELYGDEDGDEDGDEGVST